MNTVGKVLLEQYQITKWNCKYQHDNNNNSNNDDNNNTPTKDVFGRKTEIEE